MNRSHALLLALAICALLGLAAAARLMCAPRAPEASTGLAPDPERTAREPSGASLAADVPAGRAGARVEEAVPPPADSTGTSSALLAGQVAVSFCVVDARTRAPIEHFRVQHESGSRALVEKGPDSNVAGFSPGCAQLWLHRSEEQSTLTLRVKATGFRTWSREDVALKRGVVNDLGLVELEPVPAVSVHVVDASDGRALGGALVVLFAETLLPERADEVRKLAELARQVREGVAFRDAAAAFSDDTGTARLESLPGVTCALLVLHPERAPRVEHGFFLPFDEPAERTLALESGGTVLARVRTSRDEPVPAQAVERRDVGALGALDAAAEALCASRRATSAADGVARFEHLAPGVHAFRIERVYGEGMFLLDAEDEDPSHPRSGFVTVDVPASPPREITLLVADEGRLCVHVLSGGRPLVAARVRIVSGASTESLFLREGQSASEVTDAAGQACFAHLSLGPRYVSIEHDERSLPSECAVEIRSGENVLEIDLGEASIEGRVTDTAGRPVHGAIVQAELVQMRGDYGGGGIVAHENLQGDVSLSTFSNAPAGRGVTTGADGRYVLHRLPSATSLRVTARCGSFVSRRTIAVELAPNEGRTGVDLPLERAGSLRVRVRDAREAPLAGWYVSIEPLDVPLDGVKRAGAIVIGNPLVPQPPAPPAPEPFSASFLETHWPHPMGRSGRVVLRDLAPGRWSVLVGRPVDGDMTADSKSAEIVVEPGAETPLDFTIDG